ncbi:MAG: Holliday junction resolvase RuvX [Chloroflexi bacterium]|nr:Holliday junction resolvase RuvX [Chloroflexota bacterium]MBG54216.1 Holliday junction resolvase RuvX [Chloroflexota bacterium]|tara:strand:- start:4046 stop:4480 length:435 start_codon:yes stop_codon:yes gene_type:complete
MLNDQQPILALDVGESRIGIAISDPTKTLASPVKTVQTGNALHEILEFVDRNNVAAILIGLPYLPSGEKGVQYGKTKNFINEISDLTNTPIITIDERYSTIEAKKKILESINLNHSKRSKKHIPKNLIDSASATVILQSYLDNL